MCVLLLLLLPLMLLLQMLPASAAGGGLLNEDQSWGRLLVKLPLKHPSKANRKAGEIELEVRPAHVDAPHTSFQPSYLALSCTCLQVELYMPSRLLLLPVAFPCSV